MHYGPVRRAWGPSVSRSADQVVRHVIATPLDELAACSMGELRRARIRLTEAIDQAVEDYRAANPPEWRLLEGATA